MAKKAETKTAKPRKLRAWTKEDVRMLKALAREKTKMSSRGSLSGACMRRDTKHRLLACRWAEVEGGRGCEVI
jgi:hypothetical protein